MKKYMAPVAKTVKNIKVTILAGSPTLNDEQGNGSQLSKEGQPVFNEDEEEEDLW